ncbi:MAG: WYL domain-containing protein [Bacteroidetes bacterium]|nr:WYL domain-containing protein [Bacteroidota bacterium]MBV6461355.1 hypothetical protein [Flavobacteriales bacterium]WKZ75243.1 MAG: WYL domain-containing protein [Vicingaceae bacterium]MCL4816511.1 WYL domain-containing protein [Flavobacteriales bacterium]NOG94393.1 WYL domain-containing protein [Bacteroidota bacterium]
MSYNAIIKRYFLIIEKVASGQFPSLQEISSALAREGHEISDRTLQRDIEHIRNTFQIEIEYNKSRQGYFINKETSLNLDNFTRFLEVLNTASVFSDSVVNLKLPHSSIMFEASGNLKGADYIKPVLLAIKNRKKISFAHHNYTFNSKKEYTIHPYLLKEYLYRWYVVGVLDHSKEIRTFGLDRIENLQILTQGYAPTKQFNAKELFKHTIGLTYTTPSPQEILFKVDSIQAKYLEALPLHHSQQKINEDKKGIVFSIFVTPNVELVQQLLSWGEHIQVLKPLTLANKLTKIYKNSLKNYEH